MFSLASLNNLVQGVKVSKEREGSKIKWQIRKGEVIIGEAFCKYSQKNVELQIIRRVNPQGKGLMSMLLKEILNDAKKANKDCVIDIKPFSDPHRPFESVSMARKRVYHWYKSLNFEITNDNGIYRN